MSRLRRAVHASLGRFLPGAALVLGSLGFGMAVTDPLSFGLIQLGVLALELAGLTVGFGLLVLSILPGLRADAGVDGRRSFVGGVCAPLALGIASIVTPGGASLLRIFLMSAGAGGLLGLAIFAPWLTSKPPADEAVKELTVEPDWLAPGPTQPEEQPLRHRDKRPRAETAA